MTLFEFENNIGKITIINLFKKKYSKIEKIDEINKKIFTDLIKNNSEEAELIIKQFYYLLDFIINKNNKIEMNTIKNEIQLIKKNHENFLKEIIMNLNIENLLPLLELIEKNCYKKLEGEIDNKFKNNNDINVDNEKEKIFEEIKINKTLKKENLINALRRFILRIIYEDDNDIKENDNIINLIIEDIFWDENVNKEEIKNLQKFNIQAKNIIYFYNSIQNINQEKKFKKNRNKKVIDDY